MITVEEQEINISTTSKKSRSKQSISPTMKQVAAIILGGGQGTRLYPLTLTRSKPCVSFGGYYRIIDVAISNAINSGCQKISIITQFFSSSLHHHIYRTYREDSFTNGALQLLTAEERPNQRGWFSGTADAVRQNLAYLSECSADYFLILSGDQLYNINFEEMLSFAYASDADLTIASTQVDEETSKRMGLLKIDGQQRVTDFIEKPQHPEAIAPFRIPGRVLKKGNDTNKAFLASMGIYLFKRKALIDLLKADDREDFGKHLIPTKVSQGKTFAYLYNGYWEDIGTIASFHQANMALTELHPAFQCNSEEWPLYCRHNNLPGPKILNTSLNRAILCEGCVIEADEITSSIIGPRTTIKKGCIIRNTYIIGNNFYTPPKHSELPNDLWIGENTMIFNAIIDKHVSIGKGVQLVNKDKLSHYDSPHVYIRDGIIVVPRGATIPDGYIL